MPEATADLVVFATVTATATANLVVNAGVPAGSASATADLVVSAPQTDVATATADLVVGSANPVGAEATADLIVRGRNTMPLFRFDGSALVPHDIYRVNNDLSMTVMSLFRVDTDGVTLLPIGATGPQTLPPTTVTASSGNGQVTVSWTGVSGATGYQLSRTGLGATSTTEAASQRTKLFTGLTNGTAYTFSVQPLPGGPVTSVTLTPQQTAQSGVVKPIVGIGGGPESSQFTPLNVNSNPDRQIGPMLARRSYDSGLPSSFAASLAASDVAAGRISCWSFKPSLSQVRSSAWKSQFSAFLDTIPAGHKVRIIVHHEPENNMADFTIQGYGEMQNTVADLVHQKNRPELTFGPCWMGTDSWATTSGYYTWINGPVRWQDVIDFSKMDFLGIDPYKTTDNTRSFETLCTVNNNGAGTGGSALSMMAWLEQWDIPISIMEWGWFRKQPSGHTNAQPPESPYPDSTVAPWITAAYEWIKRWNAAHPPRVENGKVRGSTVDLLLWFNYTLMGSDNPISGYLVSPGPWNTPLKLDAYRKAIADSKIATGGTTPTSVFSPSPTTGTAPLAVSFTNNSTGSPTTFAWNFGDGTTSTAQNPSKTYSTPGARTVTLTVSNSYGSSVSARTITVT